MKTTSALLILTVMAIGCTKLVQDTDNSTSCDNAVCTMEFRTVMVTVSNSDGIKVPLDSISVTDLKNNEDITRQLEPFEWEMAIEAGSYPLFGDENLQKYQNQSLEVLFQGFIAGTAVVNEEFTVGADCCHVGLIKGNTDIVIPN